MNKKKLNYILLPLVLLIWGWVIYTVVSGFSNDNEGYVLQSSLPTVQMEEMTQDTFVLLANYRDPFLKRTYTNYSSGSSTTNNNPKKQTNNKKAETEKPKKKPVDFSFIRYGGRVKNQKTGKHVGMLNVNGRDFLVNEGEMVGQVKLIQLLEDSIKVSYQNNYAFIKKN